MIIAYVWLGISNSFSSFFNYDGILLSQSTSRLVSFEQASFMWEERNSNTKF